MARTEGKCIGDCSQCGLLSAGEVDMIPCILDQIFARVRRQGAELAGIKKMLVERSAMPAVQLAGIDMTETAPEEVDTIPGIEEEV